MSYRLNDWWLTNPDYVTPKKGDEVGVEIVEIEGEEQKVERKYVTFDVPDLSVEPFTYIYRGASSADKGNSVEVVADLSEVDSTENYLAVYIDDGTYRQGIKIYKGKVVLLDGSDQKTVENAAATAHRYTLSMLDGKFVCYFDKKKIFTPEEVPASSGESRLVVGFPESQSGSFKAKFEYIKYAEGVYTYVNLEDVDFEFQLDSAPTFDTVNLKTYNRASFIKTPPNYDDETAEEREIREKNEEMYEDLPNAWDPVEHVCGSYVNGEYDHKGIVNSISIALPQKPDMALPAFYYRVKIAGEGYNSPYSQTYFSSLTTPEIFPHTADVYYEQAGQFPVPLEGYIFVYDVTDGVAGIERISYTQDDAGMHRLYSTAEGAVIVLPPIPVSDNWKISLCNVGDYTINVQSALGDQLLHVEPKQVVSYEFDTADYKWYSFIEHDIAFFNLRPDISSAIFKSVYTSHIPSYDYVYTKDYNSGNIATIVRAEASEVAKLFTQQQNQSDMLSIYKADNDDFTERWKNIFNLSESLFKNKAEMRDTFQVLVGNSLEQMRAASIERVLMAVTGAKPDIIELKDVIFNIIWSAHDLKEQPHSRKFSLCDKDYPSYYVNPFIVYDKQDQHHTWQVKVYDPYNLQYSQDLIKQIIQLYKPGWTHVIVDFYNAEGEKIQKKYVYWYDNYLKSSYNK